MQGASTFPPKVSNFIRLWHTPVVLLGQDFDCFCYFESPSVACQWWYLLVGLFPVPLSSHSFLQNPLASSMFSNIRESSRARFPGSLYLGRSFSCSLFNISLKFANTLPGTVLNCWLITHDTSCFFVLSSSRFYLRSSDFFSPCS